MKLRASLAAVFVVLACCGAACSKKAEPPPPPPAAPKPPAASTEAVWTAEQIAFITEKFGELQRTDSGLYFKVLQPGQGDEKPPRGKLCSVRYRGTFLDGRVFDQTRDDAPRQFRVGVGHVIKGWDQTLADMRKGEKRLIVVPYWLGYGEQGKIPYILPRATLVFEIELLGWVDTTKVPAGGQ